MAGKPTPPIVELQKGAIKAGTRNAVGGERGFGGEPHHYDCIFSRVVDGWGMDVLCCRVCLIRRYCCLQVEIRVRGFWVDAYDL